MKLVLIVKLIFYKDVPFNFLLPSLNNYIKANVFYGNTNVKKNAFLGFKLRLICLFVYTGEMQDCNFKHFKRI